MVVYVRAQGARVVKEGRHLLVKKTARFSTPFLPTTQTTGPAGQPGNHSSGTHAIGSRRVDFVFLSQTAAIYRAWPAGKPGMFPEAAPVELAGNEEFALNFARQVGGRKLANMATLLWRIKRSACSGGRPFGRPGPGIIGWIERGRRSRRRARL